jgi:hypothetical protein
MILILVLFLQLDLTSASGQECYTSMIMTPSPFMGNHGEVFKLQDGSVWEIVNEYEYMYEYYPSVTICPSRGILVLDDKRLSVSFVAKPASLEISGVSSKWSIAEETNISGMVSGMIQIGHIFKTTSGSIYEVTGLTLQLVLELEPAVIVLKNGNVFKLIVDGFDDPLICAKLK